MDHATVKLVGVHDHTPVDLELTSTIHVSEAAPPEGVATPVALEPVTLAVWVAQQDDALNIDLRLDEAAIVAACADRDPCYATEALRLIVGYATSGDETARYTHLLFRYAAVHGGRVTPISAQDHEAATDPVYERTLTDGSVERWQAGAVERTPASEAEWARALEGPLPMDVAEVQP